MDNKKLRKYRRYEMIGLAIGVILGILLNAYAILGIPALIILPILGIISWWWLLTVIPFVTIIYMIYGRK